MTIKRLVTKVKRSKTAEQAMGWVEVFEGQGPGHDSRAAVRLIEQRWPEGDAKLPRTCTRNA